MPNTHARIPGNVKKKNKEPGERCIVCDQLIKVGGVMSIEFGEFVNEKFIPDGKKPELYGACCYRKERIARVIPTYSHKVVKIFSPRECIYCGGTMNHVTAIRRPNPVTNDWKSRSDYYECGNCGAMETVDTPFRRTLPIFRGE